MKRRTGLFAILGFAFLLSGCYTQLQYSQRMNRVSDDPYIASRDVQERDNAEQAEQDRYEDGEEYTDSPYYYKDYETARWYADHGFYDGYAPLAYSGYYSNLNYGWGYPAYYGYTGYYPYHYSYWRFHSLHGHRHYPYHGYHSGFSIAFSFGFYSHYYSHYGYYYPYHPRYFGYFNYSPTIVYVNSGNRPRFDDRRRGRRSIGTSRVTRSSGNRTVRTGTGRAIRSKSSVRTRNSTGRKTKTVKRNTGRKRSTSKGSVRKSNRSRTKGATVNRTRSKSTVKVRNRSASDQNRTLNINRRTVGYQSSYRTLNRQNIRKNLKNSRIEYNPIQTRSGLSDYYRTGSRLKLRYPGAFRGFKINTRTNRSYSRPSIKYKSRSSGTRSNGSVKRIRSTRSTGTKSKSRSSGGSKSSKKKKNRGSN